MNPPDPGGFGHQGACCPLVHSFALPCLRKRTFPCRQRFTHVPEDPFGLRAKPALSSSGRGTEIRWSSPFFHTLVTLQIGLGDHAEAAGRQGLLAELDVIDHQGHGGPAVRPDQQRIGLHDIHFGLEQGRADLLQGM
jgi:hypothetical protein